MANANRARGLTPLKHLSGAPWNGGLDIYYHHSTASATAIYKGSIVQSRVGLATPGNDPLGIYQSIQMLTDGDDDALGVAWTFGTTPQLAAQVSDLNAVNYCPAASGMYIGVITDPTVIFLAQDNGTTLTAAQIGMTCDIADNDAGSTTTGRSSAVLDQGTLAAGLLNLRILNLHNRPDNELAANADWEVIFDEHIHRLTEYQTT